MGEVVPLFSEQRKSRQPMPGRLEEFLHHIRTLHGTDIQPAETVPNGYVSADHELRSRAASIHAMDHAAGMSRVTPHVHEA